MKVYSPQDFLKLPVTGLVPESSGTAPSGPVVGQLWYDSTNNQLKVYLGAGPGWVQCDNVTGGTASNVTDGDKGEITVTGGVWTIDNSVVTSAKIADATILGADLSPTLYAPPEGGSASAGSAALRSLGVAANKALPGDVPLNQIMPPLSDLSLNSHKIVNLLDPTAPQDGATKAYVDAQSQGLDTKNSARFKVTSVPGPGYSGSGTGTWPSVIGLADGAVTPVAGDRVLVDIPGGNVGNGIFVYTPQFLTRAPDMDSWAEIPGAFCFVEEGTYQDIGYVCTNNAGGTLSTTPITWTQFSSVGNYTGGNGLTLTGLDFSVNVDNVGIEIATDTLRLKDGGVTSAKIADGTIVAADLAPGTIPGSLPPSGAAGGDLTGTYPNPTIANGAVTSAKIADGTITDTDVATANKDGAAATPSMRTLGTGATQAAPGNDPRFTDARPPTAHHATHEPGGSDPMAVDAAAATGSLRTLGTGAQQAAAGNHTHPGTTRTYGTLTPALTANTWSADITHNLGATGVLVGIKEASSGEGVQMDWRSTGLQTIQLRSGLAVAASALELTVAY